MAIKLIESLRSTKRTTIRYKGLKIRLSNKTTAIAKYDSTTNGRYFPTKRHFQALSFEGSSKLVLSFERLRILTSSFFGLPNGT